MFPDHVREFCAHVHQFCGYIDDAVHCPDLVDFDVVNKKNEVVMKMAAWMSTEAEKEGHAYRSNR